LKITIIKLSKNYEYIHNNYDIIGRNCEIDQDIIFSHPQKKK